MQLQINHLARIEGHANLVVDLDRGELVSCRFDVVESPRFFEGLLVGLPVAEVAPVTARICGICSASHTLVSLAASEAALGIVVSDQTRLLRELLLGGEILQSHLLQLYFMALPDYLGVPGLLDAARGDRELLERALRLKQAANAICRTIGGRVVHPVTPCLGGFAVLPELSELQQLRRALHDILPDLEATVDLFSSLEFPNYDRDWVALSLAAEDAYPVFGDGLISSSGRRLTVAEFAGVIAERVVPHSTARHALLEGAPYQVGSLARLRNHYPKLSPMATRVAEVLKIGPEERNPYRLLLARLVEVIHFAERCLLGIDHLLENGLADEGPVPPVRHGSGAAAIEAPRGLLFHAYRYDDSGRLQEADCVIPTAQNLACLEADLRQRVPQVAHLEPDEVTRQLEMLVRAYDPCISCATHLLRVKYL